MLKLNKDKFVKQILTYPHSIFITIGWHHANKHHKMLNNILNIKIYNVFIWPNFKLKQYSIIKTILYAHNNFYFKK